MNDKRIEWIDAIRGFGIFLVTFGHLNPWLPLETHIYSFHMALFFFISGFLFKNKEPFKQFMIKRVKILLIPFVFWDLLSSIISLAMGQNLKKAIAVFFVYNGELSWNAPIWFLLILFFAEIIYAVILKINDSKYISLLVMLCSAVLWVLFGSATITFKLNLVPVALFYLSFGDLIHRLFEKKALTKMTASITALIFAALSVLFGAVLNSRISYTGGDFGNTFYSMIAGIAGTMTYYLIFKYLIGGNKLLEMLGKNSMIIMASQYFFFTFFDYFSTRFLKISIWHSRGTIKAFITSIVTMALITAIVSLIKYLFRNKPKVLNLLKYTGIR